MIEAPTNCPSCNSALEWSNDLLYCRNPECGSAKQKQFQHFTSTLKIMGLGPSTLEKLNIGNIIELYEMDVEYITNCIGSEKLATKIYEEIQQSTKRDLNLVLPAFGISLIGNTATDKLAKVCDSIFDIDERTCKEAGLGPKATANLVSWLDNNLHWVTELPFSFEFSKKSMGSSGVVCISGKLTSFSTKQEAQSILENLGYVVKSSLTKDVTILINESGRETSKTETARKAGIQIVTNLKTFIGDNN